MRHDPTEVAKNLIAELGRDDALAHAINSAIDARAKANLYDLSIWREVKRIIARQIPTKT